MRVIISESQYKRLQEIDWEDTFSDVNASCITPNRLVEMLNAELYKKMASDSQKKKSKKKMKVYQPLHSKKSKENLTAYDYEGNIGVDIGAYRDAITTFPKTVFDFKSNVKMKKSSREGLYEVVNTGLPALLAVVYDKDAQEFMMINTCPSAGTCKNVCYARNGQYGMNDGLILKLLQRVNLLMNNPELYKKMAYSELMLYAIRINARGGKMMIRWNDAGDFFSRKYFEIARDVTEQLIKDGFKVKSYAYTKMKDYYLLGSDDMVMNFSKGAKKKEQDALDMENTKYSDIVPSELFDDLFIKTGGRYQRDESTGLPKMVDGGEQELKKRISKEYNIPLSRLKFHHELPAKEGEKFQYDVIVMPVGDIDISAQRWDVQKTLLLVH